jgi:hypothetical protein
VGNQYGTSEYTETVNVAVDNCVGIDEHGGWTSAVNLFPNPAHDKVTLTVPANALGYNVKVINLLGAVVLQDRLHDSAGEITFNLDGIRKGVYFVQVENGGTTVTRKFIVD